MTGYHEPKVIDPLELEIGDEVGCINAGRTLQVMTTDPQDWIDEFWVALRNKPADTTWVCDEQVPCGSVALKLGDFHHDWKIAALPRVWARRRVR